MSFSVDCIVESRGLTKHLAGKTLVADLDFCLRPGQFFGILGPNGAGKTTTLRMLMGQSPKTAGSLQIFGLPMPEKGREIRKRLGLVPQMDNLDPDFTVRQNLQMFGHYFAIPKKILANRINELLAFVELEKQAEQKIMTLSGGMKRRLTIARALINDPDLIILDEPTTGLDPQVRHLLWSRLRLLKKQGKTILLTTHYMDEAERLCENILLMDHGRKLLEGSPRQIIQKNLPAMVLEVEATLEQLQKRLPQALWSAVQVEALPERCFIYANDVKPLTQALEELPETVVFQHRPANLEDVFLKLTGRDLRT